MMEETMMNFLCDREKKLEAMLAVVRDVQGGKSLAGACKEHGASYHHVRSLLKSVSFERMWMETRTMYEAVEFDLTPCETLYKLVFGSDFDDAVLPNGAEETVEYILNTKLTQREASILRDCLGLNNEEGMALTFEEAGKKRGLTGERIRQIEMKAIRKLQHPETARILAYGLDGYEKHMEIVRLRAENEKHRNELEIKKLQKEQAELLVRQKACELTEEERILTSEEESSPLRREQLEAVLATPIEELELSVRAYNGLKRGCYKQNGQLAYASMHTVGDVLRCSHLAKVRQLGRNSLSEIEQKISELLAAVNLTWEQAREMLEAEENDDVQKQ